MADENKLPIRLNHYIRNNDDDNFLSDVYEYIVADDVVYCVVSVDVGWFTLKRKEMWQPLLWSEDYNRDGDCDCDYDDYSPFIYCRMTSYCKDKVTPQSGCQNLDPYSRYFEKFNKKIQSQDEEEGKRKKRKKRDDHTPHVIFTYRKQQERRYCFNNTMPHYFTSYKDYLVAKEHRTNSLHFWDKDFNETVSIHPLIHPYGDMIYYPSGIIAQVIPENQYSLDEKDKNKWDIHYCEILDKDEKNTLLRNFNKNSKNLDCLFTDFNFALTMLTDNLTYSGEKLHELKLYLTSFLSREEIYQELLYFFDKRFLRFAVLRLSAY